LFLESKLAPGQRGRTRGLEETVEAVEGDMDTVRLRVGMDSGCWRRDRKSARGRESIERGEMVDGGKEANHGVELWKTRWISSSG